jgi:hypothetical protein
MTKKRKKREIDKINTSKHRNINIGIILAVAFFILVIAVFTQKTVATPVGLNWSTPTTDTGPTFTPESRSDSGGTITTLVANATQQDTNWKAYIGNVSGKLTLDSSTGKTIYDWDLSTVTGEVYASRYSSINWSQINCSTAAIDTNEMNNLSMAASDSDSLIKTFNESNHTAFMVGTRNMTNCNYTAMYVNDTRPLVNSTSVFQEVLLGDSDSKLVYTTVINHDKMGYNANMYDFQMIVGENGDSATPKTYYFWAELG